MVRRLFVRDHTISLTTLVVRHCRHGWRQPQYFQHLHYFVYHCQLVTVDQQAWQPSVHLQVWIGGHFGCHQAIRSRDHGRHYRHAEQNLPGNQLCLPLCASLPPRNALCGTHPKGAWLEDYLQLAGTAGKPC